ncbi:hypothetical protein BG015_011326, partial [Linnemannia schmuckeri]
MKILSLLVATTLVIASCVEALPQPIVAVEDDWVVDAERQRAAQADYDFFARAVIPSTVPVPSWTLTSVTTVKPPKTSLPPVTTVKPPKTSLPPGTTVKPPKTSLPPVTTVKPPKTSLPPVTTVKPPKPTVTVSTTTI